VAWLALGQRRASRGGFGPAAGGTSRGMAPTGSGRLDQQLLVRSPRAQEAVDARAT